MSVNSQGFISNPTENNSVTLLTSWIALVWSQSPPWWWGCLLGLYLKVKALKVFEAKKMLPMNMLKFTFFWFANCNSIFMAYAGLKKGD